MKKEISLTDKNIFEIFIGKRVLKSDVFTPTGSIPVYSANVFKPFGLIDKTNIQDFSHDYILWGIDGKFEFNIMKKGIKFATTDHCGAIRILNKNIIPEYLLYQLNLKSHILGFDRSLRASLKNMATITIDIPLDVYGKFDVNLQERIATRFNIVKGLKTRLGDIRQDFDDIKIGVAPTDIGKHKIVSLGDEKLFKVDNGRRITQKDIDKAKGDIPVYSASKYENEALGFVSNDIKKITGDAKCFEGVNLTINADGSVGSVFVRVGKFYANDVCNVLLPLNKDIDPYYLKYEIRTQIYSLGLNWTNKLYKNKLKKLEIRIPIDKTGNFDIKKQKYLSQRYNKSEELRLRLIDVVKHLESAYIDI